MAIVAGRSSDNAYQMSNATLFDSLCSALIDCQFKTGQSGWIITCIAKGGQSRSVQSSLETENAFNFQNLITEKGTQLALCRTVLTLCFHCLSFRSRIRSDVSKNFVVHNQTTAKCAVCDEIIRHHGNITNLREHLTYDATSIVYQPAASTIVEIYFKGKI